MLLLLRFSLRIPSWESPLSFDTGLLVDWVADKTYGAWFDYLSDKPTLNEFGQNLLDAQRKRDVERASGVGVGGQTIVASKEVVAERVASAKKEVNSYLLSQGQHWTQATFEGAGDKLLSTVILIAAVALGVYFVAQIGKAYVSRR